MAKDVGPRLVKSGTGVRGRLVAGKHGKVAGWQGGMAGKQGKLPLNIGGSTQRQWIGSEWQKLVGPDCEDRQQHERQIPGESISLSL